MTPAAPQRSIAASARSYALLSVGAALITIILKASAYWLTGSVGLLSDAVKSLVNLVAALIAVWALTLASRPPDADHAYGHTKAEYFASALEPVEDPVSWEDQSLDRANGDGADDRGDALGLGLPDQIRL